jgi:DNA-binding NarL/FixJ family response regulator
MIPLSEIPAPRVSRADPERLTPREEEISLLVAAAYSNKEIAVQLGVALDTVKNHLRAIFEKIGVTERTSLALFMIRRRYAA